MFHNSFHCLSFSSHVHRHSDGYYTRDFSQRMAEHFTICRCVKMFAACARIILNSLKEQALALTFIVTLTGSCLPKGEKPYLTIHFGSVCDSHESLQDERRQQQQIFISYSALHSILCMNTQSIFGVFRYSSRLKYMRNSFCFITRIGVKLKLFDADLKEAPKSSKPTFILYLCKFLNLAVRYLSEMI